MPPSSGSEAEVRKALDRIGDGFIIFDRDWRILYVNRAAEQYFQRTRDELLGRVIFEVLPATRGSEVENVLREVVATGEATEFEMWAPAMRLWVSFRAFPDAQGLSLSFHDITDKKQIADALRASEAKHRALFEHALDGILFTAPTGEIFAANPAACRMLGRTEEEICALGRSGLIDTTDPRLPALLEVRRRTGHVRSEVRFKRKDGSVFPGEVSSAIYLDAEGRERTSMVIRDLSEQKRAEDRLQLIADAGAVLGSSLDSRATLASLTALVVPRIADQCVVHLLEDDELRRVAAAHDDPAQHMAMAPVAHEVARTGEARLVEREGISAVVVPIVARAKTLGVLCLLCDERRAYEAGDLVTARAIADRAGFAIDNARLYEQTEDAKRLRDEVIGIVSHDLRNPLSAILVAARLLSRKVEARELGSIERSAKYALSLIGDLLTVAALEASMLPIERCPESMTSIVEEAVSLQRPLAEERALRLETSVAADLPKVSVDRNRILQVLANLIGNAVKFSPEGGRIRVECRCEASAVSVAVSDTGPGIPEEEQAHVFDRFWQGVHAKRAGAGLGLAIAKGIVEAHGGTIAVESVEGQGATFRFSLPGGC